MALNRFILYQKDRKKIVTMKGFDSTIKNIKYGLPREGILGQESDS